MIELGSHMTIYLMPKLLSMRSINDIHISQIQQLNPFRLALLVVFEGGWCHDKVIYYQ
jgi:hypothetical protein